MFRIRTIHLRASPTAILVMVLLLFSCSPLPFSLNHSAPGPIEPTPTSTGVEEPPVSQRHDDLLHLVGSDPASVDNSRLSVTPVGELHVTGSAPDVDISNYRLAVDGLVDTPLTLTYEALMTCPAVTDVVLLICPGVFADNAEWTGVPVATLLAEAGLKPGAGRVTFYALDGYRQTLSLEEVQRQGVFLAHTVDGQILPRDHGYPLRLVLKGKDGGSWLKWVTRVEVTS